MEMGRVNRGSAEEGEREDRYRLFGDEESSE